MAAVLKTARALTRPRGFESHTLRCVISQDIEDTVNPHWSRCFRFRTSWFAGGLVVAAGVEGQVAEQFAGGGADDSDVQVLNQQQDVGLGVGPADAEVVEAAAVAQGDRAGGIDLVGADPVVGVGGPVAGGGLGAGGAGGGGGGPVRQGFVRSAGVVVAGERIEQGLQL